MHFTHSGLSQVPFLDLKPHHIWYLVQHSSICAIYILYTYTYFREKEPEGR